ncbi:MAG: hypothetical protein KZQ89_02925 [Candidatus Thiodiazotropha sp. (ex Lucinoma kastoroae)]|nr:hypothetical protein [Candidatus Thiodiazotropha sp. (ex Lucinoma kastoroae)]
MPTSETSYNNIESVKKRTYFLAAILIVVSAATTGFGFHAILPGVDWVHYTLTVAMTLAVFATLRLVWEWQIAIFINLAADKPSNLAIFAHLLGVVLTTSASLIPTYIAIVYESAQHHDMIVHHAIVDEQKSKAKRNYKAITSSRSFIETQADSVEELMAAELLGGFSQKEGKGPVFRTYEATSRSLQQILSILDRQQDRYEDIVHRLEISDNHMRKALEGDLDLEERLTTYRKASTIQSDTFAELLELGLVSQIQITLGRFLDTTAPTKKTSGDAKTALHLAKGHARKIASDIERYIAERFTHLKPIKPYQHESPAVVSWRYIDRYFSQFVICSALDLSLWFVLLMQIAALRKAKDDHPVNPTLA